MMETPAGKNFNVKLLPVSIGIEVHGGLMRKIIKKGTVLPATTSVCLTTKFNRQPAAVIKVFAGERPRAKYNIIVTEKKFFPIPNFASGTSKLGAWVHVDIVEERLKVTCKFGLANEPQDSWEGDCKEMSRKDLNIMCKDMQRFEKEDRKEWDRLDKLWKFREWCVDLEDMFSRRLAKRLEQDADIPELLGHIRQALDWLARATESSAEVLTERRYELEDQVVPKVEYLLDSGIMDDFGNEIASEEQNLLEDGVENFSQDPIILPQDPIIVSQDPITVQDDNNTHQPAKEISFGIFDGQPCFNVKFLSGDWQSSANLKRPLNEPDPVVDGGINLALMNEDTVSIGSRSTVADSVISDIPGYDTEVVVSENEMVELNPVVDYKLSQVKLSDSDSDDDL